MPERQACIGIADHHGWVIAVTSVKIPRKPSRGRGPSAGAQVQTTSPIIDRRRIQLVDDGLPKSPHHHEAQELPLQDALRLVEQVRQSAAKCAVEALGALAAELSARVVKIALRECPSLPDSVEDCIENYRAQNVADSVMYRKCLAAAAEERKWQVHWYDHRSVIDEAVALIPGKDPKFFKSAGIALGPPWQKDHQLALAAGQLALAGS